MPDHNSVGRASDAPWWQQLFNLKRQEEKQDTGSNIRVVEGENLIPRGKKKPLQSLSDRGVSLSDGIKVIQGRASVQNAQTPEQLDKLWQGFIADKSLDGENRNLLHQAIEERRQILARH